MIKAKRNKKAQLPYTDVINIVVTINKTKDRPKKKKVKETSYLVVVLIKEAILNIPNTKNKIKIPPTIGNQTIIIYSILDTSTKKTLIKSRIVLILSSETGISSFLIALVLNNIKRPKIIKKSP